MKISNYIKGFAVSTMLVAACALQSMAETYAIGGTNATYQFWSSNGSPTNNPNEFPVVIVQSHESGAGAWGFLLDGSELSKAWLKKLDDSWLNRKALYVEVDKTAGNGYCGNYIPGRGCSPCGKILSIQVSTVE